MLSASIRWPAPPMMASASLAVPVIDHALAQARLRLTKRAIKQAADCPPIKPSSYGDMLDPRGYRDSWLAPHDRRRQGSDRLRRRRSNDTGAGPRQPRPSDAPVVADGIRGQKTERGLARSSFKIGRQNSPSRLKNEGIKEMIMALRRLANSYASPQRGRSLPNTAHQQITDSILIATLALLIAASARKIVL
jgi:hypothetical protein